MVLTEYIILPEMTPMPAKYWRDLLRSTEPVDYLKPGIYDAYGEWVCGLHEEDSEKKGRVVIEFAGVTFVWGVFSRKLEPGERGDLFFTACPALARSRVSSLSGIPQPAYRPSMIAMAFSR